MSSSGLADSLQGFTIGTAKIWLLAPGGDGPALQSVTEAMAVSKEGLVDIPAHCKSTCDAIFHHGPSAVMSCIVNSVSAEDVLHMLGKTT